MISWMAARKVVGVLDINPRSTSRRSARGRQLCAGHGGIARRAHGLRLARLPGRCRGVRRRHPSAPQDPPARRTPRSDHMTVSRDGQTIFVSALSRTGSISSTRPPAKSPAISSQASGRMTTSSRRMDCGCTTPGLGVIETLGMWLRPSGDQTGYPIRLTIADPRGRSGARADQAGRHSVRGRSTPDEKGIYAQLSNSASSSPTTSARRKWCAVWKLPFPLDGHRRLGVRRAASRAGLEPRRQDALLAGGSNYVALVRAPGSLIKTVRWATRGWAEIAGGSRSAGRQRAKQRSVIRPASGPDKIAGYCR